MAAVVRGSTGEPVILLPGEAHQDVSEAVLSDVIRAAAFVLSAAEVEAVGRAVRGLGGSRSDSYVAADGTVLTVYRLPAG